MKTLLLASLVMALVLVSGCTIPGTTIDIPFIPDFFGPNIQEETHDVIIIDSLQTVPSAEVRSGQTMTARAYIKNVQNPEMAPKNNVKISLYNTCELFDLDEAASFCTMGSEEKMGTDGSCIIDRMFPQSTAVAEWVLKARDVKVQTPCRMGVMVQYTYFTPTTYRVTFINKQELERLVTQDQSTSSGGVEGRAGEGPVKSYMGVQNQPIVYDPVAGGSGILSFWMENKGYGQIPIPSRDNVFFGNCEDLTDQGSGLGEETSEICIDIYPSEGDAGDLVQAKNENGNWGSVEECIKDRIDGTTAFIGRKTPEYSCEIRAAPGSNVKLQKTFQINSEISYLYKFTKEIDVNVKPEVSM